MPTNLISDLGSYINSNMGGSNRNCIGHGYHHLTGHGDWRTIRSESWEGYDSNTDCRWSFYAPGAKHIRVHIYQFWSHDAHDRFFARVGMGTGGGYQVLDLYGGVGDSGWTWTWETNMLHIRWYTNCCDQEKGWDGYVQRLD